VELDRGWRAGRDDQKDPGGHGPPTVRCAGLGIDVIDLYYQHRVTPA
jgi:hypothetical protein